MSHKVTFNIADSNANVLGCDELAGEFNLGASNRLAPIDATLLDAGAGVLAVAWLDYLKQRNQSEEFQFQPTGDGPQEDDPEIQTLDLDSPAGGTFKLGDGTTWTSDIAYDASAADIETALEGLYGAGNVEVTSLQKILASGQWVAPFSGKVDLWLVGGGGGAGVGGGGGGYTLLEENIAVTVGDTWDVVIGEGGAGNTGSTDNAADGQDTTFSKGATTYTALGGKRSTWTSPYHGGDGGSGGGGYGGADGGSDGANGVDGHSGNGGVGQGSTTEFDGTLYAGGGGAGGTSTLAAGSGGAGGGGDGGRDINGSPGEANTGGGGGGNDQSLHNGGKGGSGIAVVRYRHFTVTFAHSVGNSGLVADFTGLT